MPKSILYLGACVALIALIPLALAFKSRHAKTDQTRVHPIQDMDNQPKFKAQHTSPLFQVMIGEFPQDGTVARSKIPGTVARVPENQQWRHEGWDLWNNTAYYEARIYHADLDTRLLTQDPNAEYSYLEGLPDEVRAKLDASQDRNGNGIADFLDEGKEQFEIFCSACHGYDGYGDGFVTQHAMSLPVVNRGATWPQPANLVDVGTVRGWANADRGQTGFYLPETVPTAVQAFETARWQTRYNNLLATHEITPGTEIPFTDEGEFDEEAASDNLAAFVNGLQQVWGEARIDSYVFEVISNGYNQMYGYNAMISTEDRWAIAVYLNALQAAVSPVFRDRLAATSTTPLEAPASADDSEGDAE